MPPPSHSAHRKSLRHSFEWIVAFWLLVFAITLWPRHHTTAIVQLILALTLAAIGLWRVRRANRAIAEEEAAAAPPPGSDSRPIEPAGGWNPRKMLFFPVLLIALFWEFHPLAGAVLGLTPYRLLDAAPDAAPPLREGDRVWVRITRARPKPGAVIGLWDKGHRWRLATVVAAPGDTAPAAPARNWIERDATDQVVAVAYEVAQGRAVPPDSIAVTIHSRPPDAPPEVELRPASEAEAVGLRIVFPPSRWRLLP